MRACRILRGNHLAAGGVEQHPGLGGDGRRRQGLRDGGAHQHDTGGQGRKQFFHGNVSLNKVKCAGNALRQCRKRRVLIIAAPSSGIDVRAPPQLRHEILDVAACGGRSGRRRGSRSPACLAGAPSRAPAAKVMVSSSSPWIRIVSAGTSGIGHLPAARRPAPGARPAGLRRSGAAAVAPGRRCRTKSRPARPAGRETARACAPASAPCRRFRPWPSSCTPSEAPTPRKFMRTAT